MELERDVRVGSEAEVVVHDVDRQCVADTVINRRRVGHRRQRPGDS